MSLPPPLTRFKNGNYLFLFRIYHTQLFCVQVNGQHFPKIRVGKSFKLEVPKLGNTNQIESVDLRMFRVWKSEKVCLSPGDISLLSSFVHFLWAYYNRLHCLCVCGGGGGGGGANISYTQLFYNAIILRYPPMASSHLSLTVVSSHLSLNLIPSNLYLSQYVVIPSPP